MIIAFISAALSGLYFIYCGICVFRKKNEMLAFARTTALPLPQYSVPFGGAVMIVGGALQLSVVAFRPGCLVLIVFLVLANVFVHPIWKPSEVKSAGVNFALIGLLLKCLAVQ